MKHHRSRWTRTLFAFLAVVALLLGRPAQAQTPTESVAGCVDSAADAFARCVGDLPWYAEALCYVKYGADAILCAPAMLLRAAS